MYVQTSYLMKSSTLLEDPLVRETRFSNPWTSKERHSKADKRWPYNQIEILNRVFFFFLIGLKLQQVALATEIRWPEK